MRTRRLVVTFDIEIDVDEKYAEWSPEDMIAGALLDIHCLPGPIAAYKVNRIHASELSL